MYAVEKLEILARTFRRSRSQRVGQTRLKCRDESFALPCLLFRQIVMISTPSANAAVKISTSTVIVIFAQLRRICSYVIRAQRAFKLFDVDITPLIAPHGGLLATIFYDKNGAVF
ncbi:hypothetical protein WJX77_004805 [Trebouxia sp. C0004]